MDWKEMQRFDGRFSISSTGLIRNNSTGKILKTNSINGYPGVVIKPNGRKGKSYAIKIHREVAQLFVENPHSKPHVNHIDGNKTNNNYTNLEWVTISENAKHAYELELRKPLFGENGTAAILSEELINKIREEYIPRHKTRGLRKLADKYGVGHSTLSEALNGVTWKHLKDGSGAV